MISQNRIFAHSLRAASRPLVGFLPLASLLAALACAAAATPAGQPGFAPAPPPAAPGAALGTPASPGARAATPADTTLTLYLLGTTDVHGHLYPYDYYTGRATSFGLALLAPLVDSVRAAHPGATYLFDSGDLLQGTPLTYLAARPAAAGAVAARRAPGAPVAPPEPHPVMVAMNLMRYDASAIGNHEYNYGIPTLDSTLAQARFPFVAANVFRHGTDQPAYRQYVLLPHVVAPGDTVLVGVTGVTPPGVLIWDRGNVLNRLDFREPVASLKPVVAEMKARGADLVVVLNHGGLEGTSYDTTSGVPPENAGARIAREVAGVDVVFLGHTHRELYDSTINGVLLTQAGAQARSLAQATVTLVRRAPSDWAVTARRAMLLRPDPRHADQALLDSLRWAHERALAYVRSVVGRATEPMEAARARAQDTPLVDFVNEVQRRAAGTELSAASSFSPEARIPAGPVSIGQIAAIYPYENTLAAVRLTGAQLRAYLEKSAEYFRTWPVPAGQSVVNYGVAGYNFDMVSGVDYTIDLSRPIGQRITRLDFRGRPVRPDQSFTMALNSYRRGGGGGYSMVAGAPAVYEKDQDIRDLLVDEVRRKGILRPADYFQRNWEIVPAAAARQAARELPDDGRRPGAAAAGAARPAPLRLRVLTTNDLHGHLLPETYAWSGGRPVGGAATLAAYFRAEREGFGGPVVLLDAGDEMQGTPISNLTGGASSVAFFDAVTDRAAAIGNHEFDWGVPVLRTRMAQARYPWLAANLFVAGSDTAPSWVHATTMLEVGGVHVGIIGLSTRETPSTTKLENVRGLEFRDGAAAIDRWVPELRRHGADFVVVVAHSGAMCDATGSADCRGEIVDWATAVHQRPDLIVAGHTHGLMRVVVNGIPIVQAASYGQRYGVVDLERATPPPAAAGSSSVSSVPSVPSVAVRDVPIAWADRLPPDSAVAALVARYQREVGPRVNAVVATLAGPLSRGMGDFALGRLLADAWRAETGAQVAFMNNGGVRAELKAGPVTWGALYELQPFNNRLAILTITGAKLRQAVETAVRGSSPDANVSGIRASYDPSRPAGARVLALTLADGTPVRDDARYTVAMPDFLAGGGDHYSAFTDPLARADSPLVDLDALIAHLKKLPQPVRPPSDPRLVSSAPGPENRDRP